MDFSQKNNLFNCPKRLTSATNVQKHERITRKTTPLSFDERIQKLNEIQRARIKNCRMVSIYNKHNKIYRWIRNRLRFCIWHHWKKLERKRKNLIRLGVEQGQAYAWSRSRMGGWTIVQSAILGYHHLGNLE